MPTSPQDLPSTTRLDPEKLIETIDRLVHRIQERFPESSLARVGSELHTVAGRTRAISSWISRPNLWLRAATTLFVLGILGATAYALTTVKLPETERLSLEQFITILEAGINDVVLIGAAVFFVITAETRVKRNRALAALHELRSVAHIIDMHQLTKDPERVLASGPATASSPERSLNRFELGRYLDYCSEMLSLTGKVAALYVQGFNDSVAVGTVNEIESLCTGLSRKIWQKIMILETTPFVEGDQTNGSQPTR